MRRDFFCLHRILPKPYLRYMSNRFPKSEKLTQKRIFEALLKEGKSIKAYPVRLIYLPQPLNQHNPYQIAFGVGKRKLKLAVDRNRVKRILREAWRLKKEDFLAAFNGKQYALLLVYMSDEKPSLDDSLELLDRILQQWPNE